MHAPLDPSTMRPGAAFLLAALAPLALGIALFLTRDSGALDASGGMSRLTWERVSITVAAVLSLVGISLLEPPVAAAGGFTFARLALSLYLLGTACLIIAEGFHLERGESPYALIVASVLLIFFGQAAFGAALIQSGLVPGWLGWLTVSWNVILPVLLIALNPSDIYYPIVHHLLPLLIAMNVFAMS